MDKNTECSKWSEFAENDYEAVILLSSSARPLLEIVCFHCQQCIEKYLKAFIVKCNGEIKKTHNLEDLCKICTVIDEDFVNIKELCIDLTDYAVETRYPYPFEIDADDMKKAVKDMETVRNFIRIKLKLNSM